MIPEIKDENHSYGIFNRQVYSEKSEKREYFEHVAVLWLNFIGDQDKQANQKIINLIQLNLSTAVTLRTEESGRCREVAGMRR